MTEQAVVFDAYGTLLDVAGAARAAAAGDSRLASVWPRLAADWRAKQLSYTWLRSLMGDYADFATVTADALDWAMAAQDISDPDLRARLLDLYRRLPVFPEVPEVLRKLTAKGHRLAILSNGTAAMLGEALEAAGIAQAFEAVLTVERLRIYKPHPSVYALATERFGARPGEIVFVSSNGWDVAGGAAFGFRAVWVNRAGEPAERLPGGPEHILADLSSLPRIIA